MAIAGPTRAPPRVRCQQEASIATARNKEAHLSYPPARALRRAIFATTIDADLQDPVLGTRSPPRTEQGAIYNGRGTRAAAGEHAADLIYNCRGFRRSPETYPGQNPNANTEKPHCFRFYEQATPEGYLSPRDTGPMSIPKTRRPSATISRPLNSGSLPDTDRAAFLLHRPDADRAASPVGRISRTGRAAPALRVTPRNRWPTADQPRNAPSARKSRSPSEPGPRHKTALRRGRRAVLANLAPPSGRFDRPVKPRPPVPGWRKPPERTGFTHRPKYRTGRSQLLISLERRWNETILPSCCLLLAPYGNERKNRVPKKPRVGGTRSSAPEQKIQKLQ